jgi:hypothetical protein
LVSPDSKHEKSSISRIDNKCCTPKPDAPLFETNNPEKRFSEEEKKKRKKLKFRLNRPRGQERSLVKREMALAEVRRREAAKQLSPFRQ